ncbi:MAG: ABC transporter permease [Spirochaetales bacterium]|nr:ABC transporter permease [Spirochaetales bacterium]
MKDFLAGLSDFWNEFRRDKAGLVGLAILTVALLTIIFEPLIVPYGEVNSRWRDINYWEDNSSGAPPAWTNLFSSAKKAVTTTLSKPKVEEIEGDGVSIFRYEFGYDYRYDEPPLDLVFRAEGWGTFPLLVSVERPDGQTIDLYQYVAEGLDGDDLRVTLANDSKSAAYQFLAANASEADMINFDSYSIKPMQIMFAEATPTMATASTPLEGEYKFVVQTMIMSEDVRIEKPHFTVVGAVSGALGSDTGKRDLFSGLVAGLKWALLIGFVTSFISVLLGVLYGIVSAYFGGAIDTTMNFVYELFVSMPVLPILIVISAVFKPSIWFIIAALVIFSWTGPVKTVRSMAMQIKEETYIEAARALGAGKWRIIFRHMLPLLIPYSFASMALAVPGAILYEASVSLLGLGDATITTWGQILHDALSSGAVLNGLWWWVVPPGLSIAIMGMSFAFIGSAMDKILHPKLRTR